MTCKTAQRVFIVEDSDLVRERLVTMLSELDHVQTIGQAGFAVEAIAGIQKSRPDLVLLDISLAKGNGLHVLKAIKSQTPAPRVIMLTNFADDLYRAKCAELGADYFFDKSREFEKVIEVLRDSG